MTKRIAIIIIALACLTAPCAGYGRPQGDRKGRWRAAGAATGSLSTKRPGLTSAGAANGAQVSMQTVGGSGSGGVIPLWTSATSLGNSAINQNSTTNNLSINGPSYPNTEVTINAGSDSGLKIITS